MVQVYNGKMALWYSALWYSAIWYSASQDTFETHVDYLTRPRPIPGELVQGVGYTYIYVHIDSMTTLA